MGQRRGHLDVPNVLQTLHKNVVAVCRCFYIHLLTRTTLEAEDLKYDLLDN